MIKTSHYILLFPPDLIRLGFFCHAPFLVKVDTINPEDLFAAAISPLHAVVVTLFVFNIH